MNRCATCKHWGAGSPSLDYDTEHEIPGPPVAKGEKRSKTLWKYCEKLDDVTLVNCDCSYEYSSDTMSYTVETFGCVLWEAK